MRRLQRTVLNLTIAVVILIVGAVEMRSQTPSKHPSAPRPAKHATTAPACGPKCGTERWPVKTLTDKDAAAVNLTPDVGKSVADLYALPAPNSSSDDTRLNATEKTTFKVHARLVGYKVEFDPSSTKANKGDHDFHIVIADLQDATKTMVIEIPDPSCGGVCASPQKQNIQAARTEFASKFPNAPPSTEFQVVQGTVEVEVTGIGFFDFAHGQTGLARNCVELHPVIAISFLQPGPFDAKVDHAGEPAKHPATFYHCIPQTHAGGTSQPAKLPAKGKSP